MKAIKSFTSLEQSRKLAEILPVESADLWWAERYAGQTTIDGQYIVEEKPMYYPSLTKPSDGNYSLYAINDIPCWSLAALLSILPEGIIESCYVSNLQKEKGKYSIAYGNNELLCVADDPIDACYEMILKLSKRKDLHINKEQS